MPDWAFMVTKTRASEIQIDVRPNHRAHVMGFAEGVGVLVVMAGDSTFMLELKSGQVKKVTMPRYLYTVLPFMSFYIPGTCVASTLFVHI